MKLRFFGDSYDIVKKSLIGWLGDCGGWSAHPMFTEPVTPDKVASFSRFLGVPLISDETLTPETNRAEYFSLCRKAGNLFLDPDTGIRLLPCQGLKSVSYVFGEELVEWSRVRPRALTLVFDQSFSRGRQIEDIQKKLAFFESQRIHGFAYSSHAPFILLSADLDLLGRARERLLQVSGLPESRLVVLAGRFSDA